MRFLLRVLAFAFLAACSDTSTTILYEPPSEAGTDDAGDEEQSDMSSIRGTSFEGPGRAGITKDGWSATGQLASQTPGKTVGLQANFDHSGVYTVQFSVTIPVQLSTGAFIPIRPQATLRWSVEGSEVVRVIDIGAGTSISGVGQAVKVSMADALTAGASPGTFYTVSAQVSPGTRPNTQAPPTLFGGAASLNNAGSHVFTVPQNAGVVSAMVTSDGGAIAGAGAGTENTIVVIAQDSAAATLSVYLASTDDPQFVTLPPQTATVTVINEGMAATVITLTWGIDG